MIRYIVKDVEKNKYYAGDSYGCGWCDRQRMADTFETKELAMIFLDGEPYSWYAIEEIYIVCR